MNDVPQKLEATISMLGGGRQIVYKLTLDTGKAHDCYVLDHIKKKEIYEPDMAAAFFRILRPGDQVIDIGAHFGYFSLLASRLVGPPGKVFAVEPLPDVVEQLRFNVRRNEMLNVEIIDRPVWSRSEEVKFWVDIDDAAGSCLWDPGLWTDNVKTREAGLEPLSMQSMALTDIPVRLDSLKLLKIDTEGADQFIFETAGSWLEQGKPPFILSELNPFGMRTLGGDTEPYRAYMRRFGYELWFIQMNGGMPAHVPAKVKVIYSDCISPFAGLLSGAVVKNVMFARPESVYQVWSEVDR